MKLKRKALNKTRVTNIIIAIILSVTACFFLYAYRPYIYQNQLNDFGLADSISNVFGTITISFWAVSFFVRPSSIDHRRFFIWIVIVFSLFFLLWEFAQINLLSGLYDNHDLVGILSSSILAIFLYNLIHPVRMKKNKVVRLKLK